MREIGDRFSNYDRIAEQQDRKARRVDTRSITSSFMSAGDACFVALDSMFSDALGGNWQGSSHDAPIKLSIELASRHAAKRAEFLGLTGSGLESAFDRGVKAIMRGVELCESPIEKRLLPWLIYEDYGPLLTFPAVLHDPKTEKEVPKGDIMIVPQMAFAKVRMDFGLVARWKEQTKIVAVECDGSAHHGALRDNWRDQYLRSWGIETVRASGEEIYAQPRSISCRAASLIADWATLL